MTDMPPMPLVMGSMASGERNNGMGNGAVMHFIVMATVVFGLAYAALFAAFDNDGWLGAGSPSASPMASSSV